MGIGAAIAASAVLGTGGALLSSSAARKAGQTQADAAVQAAQVQQQSAREAQAAQMGMYQQTRSDLAPYMQTGNQALSQLAALFGIGNGGPTTGTAQAATDALTKYPGYQFGLNQGVEALDRSAASRGMVLSGAQTKGVQEYGQNYAMQQAWQPYLSQLSGLSSLGQNAAAGVGNAGIDTGRGIAASLTGAGNAQAGGINGAALATSSGQIAGGNAISSGLSGLNSALQNYLSGQNSGGSGGGAYGQPQWALPTDPWAQSELSGLF